MGAACKCVAYLVTGKGGVTKASLKPFSSTCDYSISEAIELYPNTAWKVKNRELDYRICHEIGICCV